jgi:flagellar biosynthesis/type III secretory pathway chaperone
MTELQKITELEQILTSRYQKLDRNREELMRDIASVLNIKGDNITLTILADAIKEQKEASALLDVMKRLSDIGEALREVNENNRALVDYSLDYLEFSLNLVRSAQSKEPTLLTPTGEEISTTSQGGIFDSSQ